MKKPKISNALDILNRRHPPTKDDLSLRKGVQQQIEIAEMIHQARKDAGLSQSDLADRIGTTASVICRLENADYEGHSLTMLRRIADALGQRVEVRFVNSAKRKLRV
jgi:ribosome-binding protein aMBF1 (putative translation factor)